MSKYLVAFTITLDIILTFLLYHTFRTRNINLYRKQVLSKTNRYYPHIIKIMNVHNKYFHWRLTHRGNKTLLLNIYNTQ